MDLDAVHKQVLSLQKFRSEAEEAIAFFKGIKAAGGMPNPGSAGILTSDQVDQIVAKVVEQLGPKVTDLTGRVEKLEQAPAATVDVTAIESRLTKLEGAPATAAQDPELAGRMEAMLTWFDANKEGLEVLLSLDGEPDGAETAKSGGTDTAGTAAGGATAATGAVDAGTGTLAASNPAPAPAGAAANTGTGPGTTDPAAAPAT